MSCTNWCFGKPSISKTTPFSCNLCAEYLTDCLLNSEPGPAPLLMKSERKNKEHVNRQSPHHVTSHSPACFG